MELIVKERGKDYIGQGVLDEVAGRTLKISSTDPGGTNKMLEVTVPAGKVFRGLVVVDFTETDV